MNTPTPEQPALRAVDVQRYHISSPVILYERPHADGEWVKHADHAQALAAAGREAERLRAECYKHEADAAELVDDYHKLSWETDQANTERDDARKEAGRLSDDLLKVLAERDTHMGEAARLRGALLRILDRTSDGDGGTVHNAPSSHDMAMIAKEALKDGRGEGDGETKTTGAGRK